MIRSGPHSCIEQTFSTKKGALSAFALGHVLFVFNYIWYLAEWKALARIVTGRAGWAKTARVKEPTPAAT